MTKYLNIPYAPDVMFVVFLVSWFVTRQVLLLKIIFSVTVRPPPILHASIHPLISLVSLFMDNKIK